MPSDFGQTGLAVEIVREVGAATTFVERGIPIASRPAGDDELIDGSLALFRDPPDLGDEYELVRMGDDEEHFRYQAPTAKRERP